MNNFVYARYQHDIRKASETVSVCRELLAEEYGKEYVAIKPKTFSVALCPRRLLLQTNFII